MKKSWDSSNYNMTMKHCQIWNTTYISDFIYLQNKGFVYATAKLELERILLTLNVVTNGKISDLRTLSDFLHPFLAGMALLLEAPFEPPFLTCTKLMPKSLHSPSAEIELALLEALWAFTVSTMYKTNVLFTFNHSFWCGCNLNVGQGLLAQHILVWLVAWQWGSPCHTSPYPLFWPWDV